MDYLIDPSFQEINRLFPLLFENKTDKEVHTGCYLSKREIKDYNVMIHGRNFFDEPAKNDWRTKDDIQKISIGQGGDYTTGWLLDYIYFNEHICELQ